MCFRVAVQFTIGTPPAGQGLSRRSPVPPLTKAVQAGTLWSLANAMRGSNLALGGQLQDSTILSPIVGSPSKMPDAIACDASSPPNLPVQRKTPFGLVNCRVKTFAALPVESGRHGVLERCGSEPGSLLSRLAPADGLSKRNLGTAGGSVIMQTGVRGGGVLAHYIAPSSAPWNRSDILKSPPRQHSPNVFAFAPPELAEETLMDVSSGSRLRFES